MENEDRQSESEQEKDTPDAPDNSVLRMFESLSLKGAESIRQHIAKTIDEEHYLRVAGQSHADARAYVIYGALDEVEKSAMQLMNIRELLSGEEISPRTDRISRNVIISILETIRVRGRRLIETLVLLVLFTSTNEQDYYRHLLCLEALVSLLRENQNLEEFHGARSIGMDRRIEDQVKRLVDLQTANPSLSQAWYADNGMARLQVGVIPNANNLLRSARGRIQRALPLMTANEKISFGFTYGEGYGESSESIHYSAGSDDWKISEGEELKEAKRLGLLAWDVLLRCHELLGSPTLSVISKLEGLYKENARPAELVYRQTVGNLKKGDFVLVYGVTFLAEILEVADSAYGYRSFRIEFLAERPMFDVEVEWVPARYVRKLYTQEEMFNRLDESLAAGPEDLRALTKDILLNATPEQLQEALGQTLKDMWNFGLREWFRRGRFRQQDNSRETVAGDVDGGSQS